MTIIVEMDNLIEVNTTQELPGMKMNDSYQAPVNDSYEELPIDMRFNQGHVVTIVTYSILMVISAIGNTTVLVLILRMKRKPGKTYPLIMMLMHLSIADLFATFLMMPLEIGWAITVSWTAGDAMCRIMAFFRIFGLYLSSFILVCISVDRYYAIKRPLQLIAERRRKIMVAMAWIGAALCSAPQMVVFHLEAHPDITWYEQCITVNTFASYAHEVAYACFGMIMMYWFPLIVIIYTYSSIFLELCRRSREPEEDRIRRSSGEYFSRAKTRTLKISIMIIAVFVVCWTPYYVMSVWYWIDSPSAREVDQRIQKALFLFACTNSCMNPIVYGFFNIRDRRKAPVRASTIETRVTPLSLSVRLLE
ncbi:adipokinetic hormone/corazonin-related peptide receptor variant I-like isoform X2 [Prorops nasuta]|uniref:adipokinetic hormone/corazonin-related peptide receptor variant I-like isoform X2 n=1 Tax=Prorops nasuta TaxID=863751 RepID=UPI0034CFA4A8